MNPTTPIVDVQDVSFRYDASEAWVLEDVSFKVEQGEFVGLIGPNGGGKTTLLRILLGLLPPDRGHVRILGRSPCAMSKHVGYVPQQSQIDPEAPATVEDVVLTGRLGLKVWGFRYGPSDRQAAQAAMARVGVTPFAKRRIGELSGGQRQRVLISRALAGDPALLLLDEPMAGVDAHMEQGLIEVLRDLLVDLPVILVSHDLGFVSAHVHRVGCLNHRLSMHAPNEITDRVIADMYREVGPVQQLGHTAHCPFALESHEEAPHEPHA